MTLETFMIGTKGYKMREAAAFRKNRSHRLTTEEVRAARFANLHGNAEAEPAVELEAVEPAVEVEAAVEAQPEQTDAPADEAAGEDEGEAEAEAADEAPAEGDTTQKKAGKAKKKAGK